MAVEGFVEVPNTVRQFKKREETIEQGKFLCPSKKLTTFLQNHDNRIRQDYDEKQEFLNDFTNGKNIKIYVDTKTINNRAAVAVYTSTILIWIILTMTTYIIYTRL